MTDKKINKQVELKGKKILFFCPKFFGYEKHIIAEIEAMGAEVSFLKDRLFDSPLQAALTRLFPSIATLLASKFIVRMLDAMPNNSQFDLLFVINGQTLSKIFLNRFKVLNPNAQSILYIWEE
jgi:predicted metal-dependent phosphoesterase TrpH